MNDAHSGELPKAFVVLKSRRTSSAEEVQQIGPAEASVAAVQDARQEIDDYIKSKMASYKWLRGGIDIVQSIPKSPSGKTLRRLLKDKEARRHVASGKL